MRVWNSLDEVPTDLPRTVVTLGNFDGVHRGHREVLRRVVELARARDALAVAVGSSHAMASRDAALDDHLIAALAGAVDVPLVLHGSSGVPDDGLARAVERGIAKVNVGTRLNQLKLICSAQANAFS